MSEPVASPLLPERDAAGHRYECSDLIDCHCDDLLEEKEAMHTDQTEVAKHLPEHLNENYPTKHRKVLIRKHINAVDAQIAELDLQKIALDKEKAELRKLSAGLK